MTKGNGRMSLCKKLHFLLRRPGHLSPLLVKSDLCTCIPVVACSVWFQAFIFGTPIALERVSRNPNPLPYCGIVSCCSVTQSLSGWTESISSSFCTQVVKLLLTLKTFIFWAHISRFISENTVGRHTHNFWRYSLINWKLKVILFHQSHLELGMTLQKDFAPSVSICFWMSRPPGKIHYIFLPTFKTIRLAPLCYHCAFDCFTGVAFLLPACKWPDLFAYFVKTGEWFLGLWKLHKLDVF